MTPTPRNRSSRWWRLLPLLAILSLIIAACGAPAPTGTTQSPSPAAESPAAESPAAESPAAESPSPAAESPAPESPEPAESPAAESPAASPSTGGLVTVSEQQQATWVRNFNPFVADNRWPTLYGIYEPMFIHNIVQGETVPWLATEWTWNDGSTELTFTIREGVQWSDGEPLTANDVAFTFRMFDEHAGLQGTGSGIWNYISNVEATDDQTVVFTFEEPFTPAMFDIGHQNIVPEHIWGEISDPLQFTNENPIATGPFTEIAVFQNQYWELHRNPNYWQEGKPSFQGFRFPSYPGNDQANLATINGENDWAGNFIPDIDTTFVSRNPEHHGYWFPATGASVMLYLNTSRAPFDNADVRKAISMAINRDQIVEVAMYGYTHPADATGLSDAYDNWRSEEAVAAGDWVMMDVDRANELLDAAGLERGAGGIRQLPDGTPLRYDINVVSGWTDWVSSCQIMAQNLRAVGIDATVRTYDFSAWFERVQTGDFDMSIGWSSGGPTPFNYYRGQMSSESWNPIGEASGENWHRFQSEAADRLLAQFAASSDEAEQQEAMNQLQMLFAQEAPAIPLFPGPQWYEYNTTRFTGWPNADDPYAIGSTYATERLIVMMNIEPR
jgi:peptide/nickel transport system substrate-binding protein